MSDDTNFVDDEYERVSLTHHTFAVGVWRGAPTGSVLVTQYDDLGQPVLLLKPDDYGKLVGALFEAAKR